MTVWLWVLVGVVVLILLVVLWAVVMDRLEIRRLMNDPAYMQGIEAMIKDTKAETQSRSVPNSYSGSRNPPEEIAEFVRTSNLSALLQLFNLADSWETRELVAVAVGNMCRDGKEEVDYSRAEMVSALQSMFKLCKAETSGGSYRENCLDHVQMLLRRFD